MIKGRENYCVNPKALTKLKSGGCPPTLKEKLCNHVKRAQESSNILKNVLDIATTLVKIMKICGINECKSNKALDIIIYSFMHFDEVTDHPGGKSKKRIRKEEFYTDLMRDCGMTKVEARLSYSIAKVAFKAFYHKQVVNRYDPKYVDECEWKNAANKTINEFAQSGASRSEVELAGRKILCAYENYVCRMQAKDHEILEEKITCPCGRAKQMKSQQPTNVEPCKIPCPIEPLLCGSIRGEVVCPPGNLCPQVICRDPCGRTFLKVDGDKIHFDPLIMECEARRVAMGVCSPTFPDCANICKDTGDESDPDECEEIEEKEKDERDKNLDVDYGGGVIASSSRRMEHFPSKHSTRSLGGQTLISAAASKSPSVFSAKNRKAGGEELGVFVEIVFSKDKNFTGENMLDVKLHGGCNIDKKLINSLDELEVQYNDDPPTSYSCKSKPEKLDRIAGGSNIVDLSIHSLIEEPMLVDSDMNIGRLFIYPTIESEISQPSLQKTLSDPEVKEVADEVLIVD